jgi:hypothetical protein
MIENVSLIVASLFAIAVLVLVCREVACWYFKINETLEILERINGNLTVLARSGAGVEQVASNDSSVNGKLAANIDPNLNAECPSCAGPLDLNAEKCLACNAIFRGRHAKWRPIPRV